MSRHTPGMRQWLLTLEEENKMTTQPDTLRLADDLEARFGNIFKQASVELRRLHESNQELLEALKEAHACILGDHRGNALDVLAYAINKAERTTT